MNFPCLWLYFCVLKMLYYQWWFVCVYICVCIFVCVYLCVYICVYIFVYIFVCTYLCVHICVFIFVCICISKQRMHAFVIRFVCIEKFFSIVQIFTLTCILCYVNKCLGNPNPLILLLFLPQFTQEVTFENFPSLFPWPFMGN